MLMAFEYRIIHSANGSTFESIVQAHLRTVGENGLNSVDELLRNLFHSKDRQFRKVFNNA